MRLEPPLSPPMITFSRLELIGAFLSLLSSYGSRIPQFFAQDSLQ